MEAERRGIVEGAEGCAWVVLAATRRVKTATVVGKVKRDS